MEKDIDKPKRPIRRYSVKFKEEQVKKVQSGKTIYSVALESNISKSTLLKWVTEYQKNGIDSFSRKNLKRSKGGRPRNNDKRKKGLYIRLNENEWISIVNKFNIKETDTIAEKFRNILLNKKVEVSINKYEVLDELKSNYNLMKIISNNLNQIAKVGNTYKHFKEVEIRVINETMIELEKLINETKKIYHKI